MSGESSLEQKEFSSEQKQYLQGFFAGVAQRGIVPFVGQTAAGRITADAASGLPNLAGATDAEEEALWFATPVSDLCQEERWKQEQDPRDIWQKVLALANEDRAPKDDERFRLKYHGLFYVAPAQDAFMLRLRVPGGILKSQQLRGLAQIAEDWGSGRADLTTRSNLQIREFKPRDIVRVLAGLQALGMTSRGTGADNIRNITASPLTGLDREELCDVAPLADALQMYISNSPGMHELPRKFNVAFDNGGALSAVADTNDIGFAAVQVTDGHDVPSGIYFRVLLCGITGHRQFAADCGLLLHAHQTVAVAAAMIRVFTENGDRTDRKKARLKYLVDRWGVEKFLAETEKKLDFPLLRFPADKCVPRKPIDRVGHIGIHAQKQPGLSYIGVCVPVGRLPVAQMRAVADVAERCGTGEIRLTVWQNLLIPNVPETRLAEAQQLLQNAGLAFHAGTVLSGTVACTGNKGCRFSATDTKTHAVALAEMLDSHFQIEQPVNLHVTGCHHSCAQHYIGDIGLMGVKVGGEEGYQVLIGGGPDNGAGQEPALGRELIPAIAYDELPGKLQNLFSAYMKLRSPTESFLDFSRRHPIDQLQGFCSRRETA